MRAVKMFPPGMTCSTHELMAAVLTSTRLNQSNIPAWSLREYPKPHQWERQTGVYYRLKLDNLKG